jgi:ABC-type Fe3+ transport system substrate-binding protein
MRLLTRHIIDQATMMHQPIPKITDDLLHDSLEHFLQLLPHGRFLLETLGIDSLLGRDALDELAPYLSLGDVLEKLQADPQVFLGHLATGAANAAADPDPATGGERVEANVPCALKAPLEIAFQDAALALAGQTGQPVAVTVQSENEASISNQGDHIDRLDAMPDLTMAAGYNSLLDHAFQKRWATADHFAARPWPAVNDRLAGYGFADPLGLYRVIGINVFVLVADPARLDGRPAPDTWEALLSDTFVQDVVVCGSGDKASGSLMLHVQARFGADGVRRLGRSVKSGMHPSQVIKRLGTGKPDCPAVAVMPYFFARLAGLKNPAVIRWPRDGAPAMPFFMLVKRDAREAIAGFAAHLEGEQVGRICSGAFFPSLHPDVLCPLPPEAGLAWLGWDAIRRDDLGALRRQAQLAFEAGRREVRP